ncbi:RING/FYVE/PHD zinc finger superfamily protein [Perilla frutescens var. hirtella]|nr:RING/FYVE/PHD zinc finger superfamily protein [Perilla frutescens var. hirtella]
MATLEMSHMDLECGCRSSGGGATSEEEEEEEEGSVCFSDADEGSCNSQFYSTADGDGSNYDDYSFACGSEILEDEALESRRASSAADPSDFVDLENGGAGQKMAARVSNAERDCRICHLSLVTSSPSSGIAIELGCSCKDDLAAAHKHCAETWFKIKGNKTCEICNSVARNVVGPNDIEAVQQAIENNAAAMSTPSSAPAPSTAETRTCLNGHRFLNFLLACMVFAFVISWLFHFNIPS